MSGYTYIKTLIRGLVIIWLVLPVTAFGGEAVVGNEAQLAAAVESANRGGPKNILLKDGVYELEKGLWIGADGISISGLSGNREKVVIRGRGMKGSASHIFWVAGSNFRLRNVTLADVANHLIQIHGERNADNPVISNVLFRDSFEQMIKVSYDQAKAGAGSDNGIVENCVFEYTAGIGPQYYIGGIDAHNARNWIVRRNTFRGIRSPSKETAEFAVHFWSNSKNTIVDSNKIINCDRGIGFGMGDRGHVGGEIKNNMIYHDDSEGFADSGIVLESAPGAKVYNNTIFHEHGYQNAIEYRFPVTKGVVIRNNLTNRKIAARDGAEAEVKNNITNARADWFVDAEMGDLRLKEALPGVVDSGGSFKGIDKDYYGAARPVGKAPDIGAHEYQSKP